MSPQLGTFGAWFNPSYEQLPSGSVRVFVYAGTDPLTRWTRSRGRIALDGNLSGPKVPAG
jgi:hypothetical protein